MNKLNKNKRNIIAITNQIIRRDSKRNEKKKNI